MSASAILAMVSLGAWLYLLAFRGQFWRFREQDDAPFSPALPAHWPPVVAVVPARNEADVIDRALASLAAQDYAGEFRIVLVDDQSSDGTSEAVRALGLERVTVIAGSPRPGGWTGKLWALQQGVAAAGRLQPEFLWLTDADIVHSPNNLSQLVARAESRRYALVSLMAKLACDTPAEKFFIPAFVFFFAMLFPFSRVNRPETRIAAGAGGCMLVRRNALLDAGGIEAVRGEIIDDCAMARLLKAQGPVWLGLTQRSQSIRAYHSFGDIRAMVTRSAFAQLKYSWAMLVLTLLGLALVYGAPPVLTVFAEGTPRLAAALAWLCMVVAFWPIARFYGRTPVAGIALPAIAACYAGFTLDSAIQHLRGRGGMWKGRAQAMTQEAAGEIAELGSGKTHRDENFPVASLLIAPRHRPIVLAFYRFVREADDIADHPTADADEKLRLLESMRLTLLGESNAAASGVTLRAMLAERRMTSQHALDLLEAFRRDVTKLRYRDWDDLVDYCSVSAMPVGRFVLDVHGESKALWPMNDALCAALQIINHVQDCGADFRNLNRVYIPLDAFAGAGLTPESLAQSPASPALRGIFRAMAHRNQALLDAAAPFAQAVRDRRLALEIGVIHRLAQDLNRRLMTHDPLSERVHHRRAEAAMLAMSAIVQQFFALRFGPKRAVPAGGR